MNGPLILLNVDKTLIDTHYELTAPHDVLTAAIRHAEAAGATVGLNSDSGLATLERRACQIGVNGPIIAERGALVQPERGMKPTALIPETRQFPELRAGFLDSLTLRERSSEYVVILGDVNGLSKALPPIPPYILSASTAVLVNGIRSCSIAFYVRKRAEGDRWVKDEAALDAVLAILADVGAEHIALWANRDIDRNLEHGLCIVHHKGTQKTRAVDWILGAARDRPVYMIGDSTFDDLKDPRVIQCAVKNASPAYQERCRATGGYVAKRDLTHGVIELLERIVGG